MKKKILSVILVMGMVLGAAACSKGNKSSKHRDDKSDRTTAVEDDDDYDKDNDREADQKANNDYFIIHEYESRLQLAGLTEEGKKQETLVIPAGVEICCDLSDGIVKHVSFESDDDIDLKSLLNRSETLETVKLPANLTKISSINNSPNLKEITIPKGVTEISDLCFLGDKSLETVTIEGDITRIGINAFKNCKSLKNISIPDSVTTIDNYAFSGCESLETITLPKNLKVVGMYAFQTKKGVEKTFVVPEEMELEDWGSKSLPAFDMYDKEYTVKVVSGSWADTHFDEVFCKPVNKEYA